MTSGDTEHPQSQRQEVETEYVYVEQSKSRKIGWLIFLMIIMATLVVAAIKNPSTSETKSLIKDALVEKINEKIKEETTNEENNGVERLSALLGMTLTSYIFDYFTDTKVSDYIIYSTFDCTAKDGEETKTVVSGIVVFGKIIPLKTDLKQESLDCQ